MIGTHPRLTVEEVEYAGNGHFTKFSWGHNKVLHRKTCGPTLIIGDGNRVTR